MKVSRAMARAGLAAVAVLAAMLPAGCGPSISGPKPGEETSIIQIWQVYRSYRKANKTPPKGPADLQAMQRGFPAALESIRSKEVLVFWGVGLEDGPEAASTVLAYQKDVPEKGGGVLMQDGSSRTMTAEEFRAARKPPGATTDFTLPPAGKKKR